MLDKLNADQKERLANLCEQIHQIFVEEDNEFTDDNIDEYYDSSLCKGIDDTVHELGRWC